MDSGCRQTRMYQTIGSASGVVLSDSTWASNIQNGLHTTDSTVNTYIEDSGSINGYTNSANAKKEISSPDTYSATSSQHFDNANGGRVVASGEADKNNENIDYSAPVIRLIDGGASTNLDISGNGASASGYSNSVSTTETASAPCATSSQNVNYAYGNNIGVGTSAFNNIEGESASVFTTVTSGSISPYSDSSNVGVSNADASANINANDASSIDVTSKVTNAKPNSECLSYEKGITLPTGFPNCLNIPQTYSIYQQDTNDDYWQLIPNTAIPTGSPLTGDLILVSAAPQGQGEFEFKTQGSISRFVLLSANVDAKANSNDVSITPTFSQSKPKNAIMLQPMYTSFVGWNGATDITPSVFSDLVNKGYATTSYTDSAASKDKLTSGLDNYNIVLIDSHMNPTTIAESIGMVQVPQGYEWDDPNDVCGADLNYMRNNPKPNSFMILAGCEAGFEPISSMYYLSYAVNNADLSAFYENSVNTNWNQDYLTKLFQNMGNGMTFAAADSDAWNNYMPQWCAKNGYGIVTDPTNPLTEAYLGNNYNIWRFTTNGNTCFTL